MILEGLRQLWAAGVLGMNRRNGDYIMQFNPRSAFPLVDNKLLTKRLADKYTIPTPRTIFVVERQGEVAGLRDKLASQREFVLKPARGAGGSGIVLITDYTADGFVMSSGRLMSWEDLGFHFSDVLSGIFSLSGLPDAAIIEALIHPDPLFSEVTYRGVPDIRIVVYRGVPVMSMLRLPTKVSDGKANLHRGAIGVGIDIGTGITLGGVCRSRIITHHPDTGKPVAGIGIPYWERMLHIAATATEMTGLGYLGVDLVIDREKGPLLLELNARPGLAIQLANRSGLLSRLNRVDKAPNDIFVRSESRTAWAISAFAG